MTNHLGTGPKTVENSQKPSMWEYNSKGGVPTELASLDPSAFLTSRLGQILCFLPRDVLNRICSKLPVRDFLDLSLTCRFLHWRMFTFCACYAPYRVKMRLIYDSASNFWERKRRAPTELKYYTNFGPINVEKRPADFGHKIKIGRDAEVVLRRHLLEQRDRRDLFVHEPFCLHKPYFFDTLELELSLPSYSKQYYDMCVPSIMAVRGLARYLNIIFINQRVMSFFSYPDTNDFLATIGASSYDNIVIYDGYSYILHNVEIYMNCPYARKMSRVYVYGHDITNRLNVPVFQNSIGIYHRLLDSTVIATLKNFLTGSTNLIYHQYFVFESNNRRYPLIEYLFEKFGEFEEFLYCQRVYEIYPVQSYFHEWTKLVAAENGEQLRITIRKYDGCCPGVSIGKEEMFDEMEKKYERYKGNLYEKGKMWWMMETAVEPDEAEKPDEADELNEAMETAVAKEPEEDEKSDETEEPKVVMELDVAEESGEAEEFEEHMNSDETEEEQEESGVCLCLGNTSCSIQ